MDLLGLFLLKFLIFSKLLTMESSILDSFFKFITNFGSELFYMIVIPPIFWCINKKFGFRLLLITAIAAFISTVIKNLIKLPRPPEHQWKMKPTSYAFPSGHTHGSTTFWLYSIIITRSGFLTVVGFVTVALVSISRVYLGVHYPGDILAGLALGIGTVGLFLVLDPWVTHRINTWSFERKMFIGSLPPLLLFFYGSLFFSFDDRGVRLAGAILGIMIGYILEEEFLKFSVFVSRKTKLIRTFLGLFLAFMAYFGLGVVIPYNIVTCFVVSWLGGFTVMFIAPWVFSKIEDRDI